MRRTRIALALALGIGLLATASPAVATAPRFDGRISFTSDRSGNTHNIFSMNPDGSDVRQLTFIIKDEGAAVDSAWSPDGGRIVFEQRNADSSVRQIYEMDADGGTLHQLFSDPAFLDFQPAFSPDGSRLVFSRCRPDFDGCAIYSVKADGSGGLKAVTAFDTRYGVIDFYPQYSPDGKTIAFFSENRGGLTGAVYVVASNGGDVRRITPPGIEASLPDWAPAGDTISFTANCCDTVGFQIWTMRPDGSGRRQLTPTGPEHDQGSKYSPRGDRIVFIQSTGDNSSASLVTMNADGSGMTTIQSEGSQPAWGSAR